MVRCAIEGCPNYQGKKEADNVRFFCFPKDPTLSEQWLRACGNNVQLNMNIARVCSKHFGDGDWKLQDVLLNVPEHKRKLKPEAVPTENLAESVFSKREERLRKQRQKELVEEAITAYNRKYVMDIAYHFDEPVVDHPGQHDFPRPDDPLAIPGPEAEHLLKEIRYLRQHMRKLRSRLHQAETAISSMEQIFTEGQIKRIKNPRKKYKWSFQDISLGASLYSTGPTAYAQLVKRKFPFPTPPTLRKWVAKLKVTPGILPSTVKLLFDMKLNDIDRLCILSFHEIWLGAPTHEETPDDAQSYKSGQAFIVRGLVSDWKQIIYYNYDCIDAAAVLKEVIQTLKQISFTVVAVVSGVGHRKLHLWSQMKVDNDRPFAEVINGEKIFFFGNVSHLIKNFRNCFVCYGFVVNEKCVNADPLKELLDPSMPELELNFKFTDAHVSPKKITRQNVKLAWQLLTQSVANALRKCVSMGKIYSPNAIECSDLIELFSDWLDVFNAKHTNAGESQGSLAYGLALEEQNETIVLMNHLILNINLPKHKTMLPFQRGILLNNASLVQLRAYLLQRYGINHVITNRLNQDDLEHWFRIRRANTGNGGKPTALEFKYRINSGLLDNSMQ